MGMVLQSFTVSAVVSRKAKNIFFSPVCAIPFSKTQGLYSSCYFTVALCLPFACVLTLRSVNSPPSADLFVFEMSVLMLLLIFLNSTLVTGAKDRK